MTERSSGSSRRSELPLHLCFPVWTRAGRNWFLFSRLRLSRRHSCRSSPSSEAHWFRSLPLRTLNSCPFLRDRLRTEHWSPPCPNPSRRENSLLKFSPRPHWSPHQPGLEERE